MGLTVTRHKHDSIIHARIIFSPTNTDQACGNNTPPFSSSYRTWDYATRKALVRTNVLTLSLAATHVDQQEKRPRKHSGPARATALRQSPCKDTAVEAKEPDKNTEEYIGKARAKTRLSRPKSPTKQLKKSPAKPAPVHRHGRGQRARQTSRETLRQDRSRRTAGTKGSDTH